ncbi:putative pseudouridine synthase [Erysiphe necator]|uniref:Putative pseudouridine synthase n=1 Tax=Uncinula necator TaxID=52586 RepID=A0A0B1P1W6_UNCNE|nr:putative pseudouridine synthase [Erysiphe necator]
MTNPHSSGDCTEPALKSQEKLPITTPKLNKTQTDSRRLYELIEDIHNDSVKNIGLDTQSSRETVVGIYQYVNQTRVGFNGIFKKRYTDFIVNEIALDGTVFHLTNDQAPPEFNIPNRECVINDSAVTPGLSKCHKFEESNQITLDASVTDRSSETSSNSTQLHLETAPHGKEASSTEEFGITLEDQENLRTLFGEDQKNEILQLNQRILAKPSAKSKELGTILTPPVHDRQIRCQMHQTLRRIFQNRLESSFDEASKGIRILAASKNIRRSKSTKKVDRRKSQINGKIGWNELGGEYLHMCLCKQDRDTMEVISYLARQLKVKPQIFSYAGTKDRRAVTTQRISAYRLTASTVAKINGQIYNSTVGNFKYEKSPLELGELKGNLFTITLRDCRFVHDDPIHVTQRCKKAQEALDTACKTLASSGFINYYGLQRFGTFDIGTHTIGKFILKGDYGRAVASILRTSPDAWCFAEEGHESQCSGSKIGRDELDRAQAIRGFGLGELKLDEALAKLPKRFNAERSILHHLRSRNGNDYLGALLSIPRNLRLMYVHAYQSYVWNKVVSERWARYSNKVITGDLVLIENKSKNFLEHDQYDECGEVIVRPAAHDTAIARENIFDRARALTTEEVECGNFSISDIVLPLPGFDVEYPANDIGEFYKTFMASEEGGELDPANMRRKQRDFSLSGSYRKLIATVNNIGFKTKIYYDENEQLVATDLDKIHQKRALAASEATNSETCQTKDLNINTNGLVSQALKVDVIQGTKILAQGSDGDNSVESPDFKNRIVISSDEKSVQDDTLNSSTLASIHEGPPDGNFTLVETSPISTVVNENNGTSILGKRNFDSINDSSTTTEIQGKSLETLHRSKIPKKSELSEVVSEQNNLELASSDGRSQGQENLSFTPSGIIENENAPDKNLSEISERAKLGIIIWFELSSSQYATMLLRELMGADNVQHYQPEFGARR